MRAALILVETLPHADEVSDAVDRLEASGVTPLPIGAPPDEGEAARKGRGQRARRGAGQGAATPKSVADLADLLREHDIAPTEAFVVTGDARLLPVADELGCRAILVLGDRSLMEALGPREPKEKHHPVATDLATAVRYIQDEAEEAARLGPSPFRSADGAHAPTERSLSREDLMRILTLVVIAGTAIALAFAYFLQEIYQTVTFPAAVWYLTLQFLPEWASGVLFLFFGVAIGALAARALPGTARRGSSG